MPSPAALVNTLRRGSLAEAFRRGSKADEKKDVKEPQDQPRTSPAGTGDASSYPPKILSLPTEILCQILVHVSYRDLCTLRLAGKPLHHLVSSGDVLRSWIIRHLDTHLLRLYPVPPTVSFTYLLSQHRRLRRAKHAALRYANFIERQIVWHSLMRRVPFLRDPMLHEMFRDVARDIQHKMMPLLLTVQHYLESCSAIILSLNTDEASSDAETWHRRFAVHERQVLATYKPEHLLEVYHLWLFMAWTQSSLLNRPSYVGTLERAVRGFKNDQIRSVDLDLILIFGNLSAIGQLLLGRSLKDRRSLVETWLRQLNPACSTQWRSRWNTFALQYDACPTNDQAHAALRVQMRGGVLFIESARTLLIEHSLLDATEREAVVGSAKQCTDFVEHIAGYDVLHTLPDRRPQVQRTGPGSSDSEDRDARRGEQQICAFCEREGHAEAACPHAQY